VVAVFEHAHGAAVIAAADIDRARSFYEGTLGLTPEEVPPDSGSVMYRLAGVRLLVYQTGYAGTARNTVFTVETDDLARDMVALREKGVTFEDYDLPGLTTTDRVAELPGEKAAWFADSEGNILALSQRT
jgi:catechol 2,3-dioxygenase-like lactoylglutathione lyase family enzyme